MYKILKFKGKEEDFWFCSDAHVNQTCEHWEYPLWHTRGYNSVMEHKRGFIENWNKVCDNTKICFHLGDLIFQDPKAIEFRDLVHSLNFKELYLLIGNHNSGQSVVYREKLNLQYPEIAAAELEVFPLKWDLGNKQVYFLSQYQNIQINGHFCCLCHFPIISHERQGKSSYMLCGHSHQNCAITNKDTGEGMRLDLGFDGWKRPISFAEIRNHLRNRKIDSKDHHKQGQF